MDSKEQIMIKYLLDCPTVNSESLFFNYAEGEDNTNHFVTNATDVALEKPFIDGSVMKRYSLTLYSYKSLGCRAITTDDISADENLEEMQEVQKIIDWISEQSDDRNYPDFGDDCQIDNMKSMTDKPQLLGIFQDNVGTPIARYSMTIVIEYLDNTKKLWNS